MRDISANPVKGLTNKEVEVSRKKFGSNSITKKSKKSFFRQYLASFGDPIIKILLIALFVNLLLMFRDFNWYESAGIAVAVLLATFVSTLSEYGSESAFEKLQEEAARIKCRVKREGEVVELPVDDIVVGDVVFIQAGERIPADGTLVSGELTVDQSALNGEPKEARKHYISGKSDSSSNTGGNEGFLAPDKLFRGSVACSGEGVMIVEYVGDNSFYGKLAIEIQEDAVESPLKVRLGDLARTISVFGYIAAAVLIAANLFKNIAMDNQFNPVLISAYLGNRALFIKDLMRTITLGITVIVMAVPEGLPMMITVVLSANMRRMLRDNVLVRKLVGIETSGSLNILFTDKTGTLTKGKLEVTSFIRGDGKETSAGSLKKLGGLYDAVRLNCFYNNGAQIGVKDGKREAIGGNSTDRALLSYIMEDSDGITFYEKGFSAPFNSKDKISIAEIKGSKHLFLVKGAPENLIHGCKYFLDESGAKREFGNSEALKNRLAKQAENSVRILALCSCDNLTDAKGLKNLTLTGFLGIKDEIREEARGAVAEVLGAGVQVVMVTGDNRETAVSVAASLGLIGRKGESGGGKSVLTSAELNAMIDSEVKAALPDLRVVARALPSDKSRLVKLSQEMGLVAGMTGDGVNDAPALKKADVGFAMGSGTEIAKEAGDIVILDNNFSSIVKAILYGRTIFKSIRKFLIFQLTINICAVGVSVIGPFIGVETPVTVIQMLWINMIMDTLAGLAYAGETPLPEYMREAPKKRGDKIINRYMYSQILCTGLYTTVVCLLFLKLPFIKEVFRGDDKYLLTAFFALFIFAGVFNSLNARTYRLNLLSYILRNKMFLFIMGAVSVIQVLLIYYGGPVFRTAGLRPGELLLVGALAFTVVFFDLARKMILRANNRKGFI